MKTIHHLLLSIVLLFVSPILIPSKMSAQTEVAAPDVLALGNYPATMVAVAANTTVTPDAAPTGVASINVSTDSNFKGTFVANTTTGVVA